jgi:hypothetical protein
MVDEMDLLSGLKAAESVRPRAFEEARAVLRVAMAVEGEAQETKTAVRRRARWGPRRTAGISAVALGAAAAAVALVVTSTSAPSHDTTASGKASPTGTAAGTAAAVNPTLAQLAADITVQQVKLPGNATLEIRNQSPTSDKPGDNGADLYTDDGTYYWALSESGLPQVIAQGQDVGQGQFKRAMAAAVYAVNGNITTARARMAIANLIPGANQTKLEQQAQQIEIEKIKAVDKERGIPYSPPKPLTPAQKAEQTDNFIWMNSTDALMAEPDNPQVRAGVLRIMATMPNVEVTHTTTAGQPTLTLADSWPKLADPGLVESLVINARTGFPIAMFNRDPGQPLNVTYYHTFRVTLANIEAGKF